MRRKTALAVLLAAVFALVWASVGSGSTGTRRRRRTRSRWIYVGPHNDGGWSQAHDDGPPVRAEDARQQGADDLQGEHRRRRAVQPDGREPRRAGLQDDLRDLVRLHDEGARRTSTRTSCSSRRPARPGEERRRVLRRGRGHGLPLRDGRRRGGEDAKQDRLRRRLPDPRGDPARERVRARRAADAPGRDGAARLDELLVRPGEGEEGRPEPRTQAGACVLGQNVDSPATGQYAESVNDPVGRLRLRLVDVRAEVVADRLGLQLGPVLPEAGQGGDGRHVEVRASTTARSTTASRSSPRTGRA